MRSHVTNINQGSYSCTCDPGYQSTEHNEHGSSKCEDTNECDLNNLCPQNSHCSNFDGKFEKEWSNWIILPNNWGGYECNCNDGWFAISRGDKGVTGCSEQNQCDLNCNFEHSICNNDQEQFECSCEGSSGQDSQHECNCASGYTVTIWLVWW